MERNIKSMEEKYLMPAVELVEAVFTAHKSQEEGKLVRSLVEEIRSKRFYLPELELVMEDQTEMVIGFAVFSHFHQNGLDLLTEKKRPLRCQIEALQSDEKLVTINMRYPVKYVRSLW